MKGIWKYKNLYKYSVKDSNQLSINEGDTPLKFLELDDKKLIFKDESKNPTKSFKDRYLAYALSYLKQEGENSFSISTSGNAGISLASFALQYDLNVAVFVPSDMNQQKLEYIKGMETENVKIFSSNKPRSDSFKFSREKGYFNLNKVDLEIKVQGYKSIAYEISEVEFDSIFIVMSSAVSLLGIYEGLREIQKIVPIIGVQTSKINPIARYFDQDFEQTNSSIVKCVSDRVALNKEKVLRVIKETTGTAVVVDDNLIKEAANILGKSEIFNSFNSSCCFAGLLKLNSKGIKYTNPLLILGGD